MSEIVTQLKGEAELIRSTALWKRYSREIDSAIDWYSKELRGNPKIGELVTRGAMWQEMLARLNKIDKILDSIIDSAIRADDDKSGPTA